MNDPTLTARTPPPAPVAESDELAIRTRPPTSGPELEEPAASYADVEPPATGPSTAGGP